MTIQEDSTKVTEQHTKLELIWTLYEYMCKVMMNKTMLLFRSGHYTTLLFDRIPGLRRPHTSYRATGPYLAKDKNMLFMKFAGKLWRFSREYIICIHYTIRNLGDRLQRITWDEAACNHSLKEISQLPTLRLEHFSGFGFQQSTCIQSQNVPFQFPIAMACKDFWQVIL